MERVLDRLAERMRRTPAWEDVRRADLLAASTGAERPRPSPAEEDFSNAWGRAALRDDDPDEHASTRASAESSSRPASSHQTGNGAPSAGPRTRKPVT